MAVSAIQPLENLNASHNRVLAREGLSFELSQVTLQVDFMSSWWFELFTCEADGQKTNENFYCTAWEDTWGKNLGNGLPTQRRNNILLYVCVL